MDVLVLAASGMHGLELKAERDTLRRLPGQVRAYSSVLDACTLVVAEAQHEEAARLLPPWWGLVVATRGHRGLCLHPKRAAQVNPTPEALATARLLWREEALELLREHGAARGLSGRGRNALYRKLVEVLPCAYLRAAVRSRLMRRGMWLSELMRTGATNDLTAGR